MKESGESGESSDYCVVRKRGGSVAKLIAQENPFTNEVRELILVRKEEMETRKEISDHLQ